MNTVIAHLLVVPAAAALIAISKPTAVNAFRFVVSPPPPLVRNRQRRSILAGAGAWSRGYAGVPWESRDRSTRHESSSWTTTSVSIMDDPSSGDGDGDDSDGEEPATPTAVRDDNGIDTDTAAKDEARDDRARTTNDLLDRARKLREQASALESEVAPKRVIRPSTVVEKPVVYTEVGGSSWQIAFRARVPNDGDEEKKDEGSSATAPQMQRRRVALTGKIRVKFRDDGYTDLLASRDADGDSNSSPSQPFSKVWGWDVETWDDDGDRYLQFSATLRSDSDATNDAGFEDGARLYLQARVDEVNRSTGEIALRDGKLTVKSDVKTGFWGVFNAGGILAEFREVGDFSCRPVASGS